jgi:hypothetical protein
MDDVTGGDKDEKSSRKKDWRNPKFFSQKLACNYTNLHYTAKKFYNTLEKSSRILKNASNY